MNPMDTSFNSQRMWDRIELLKRYRIPLETHRGFGGVPLPAGVYVLLHTDEVMAAENWGMSAHVLDCHGKILHNDNLSAPESIHTMPVFGTWEELVGACNDHEAPGEHGQLRELFLPPPLSLFDLPWEGQVAGPSLVEVTNPPSAPAKTSATPEDPDSMADLWAVVRGIRIPSLEELTDPQPARDQLDRGVVLGGVALLDFRPQTGRMSTSGPSPQWRVHESERGSTLRERGILAKPALQAARAPERLVSVSTLGRLRALLLNPSPPEDLLDRMRYDEEVQCLFEELTKLIAEPSDAG